MFSHILVPLDGSALAESVMPHVVAMAKAFDARCTLLRVIELCYVAGQMMPVDPLDWRVNKAEGEAYLSARAERLRQEGLQVEQAVLEGSPAQQIIDFGQAQKADLIILSSHGQSGLSRWNVSSVVQKVLNQAHISTLVARAYLAVPHDWGALQYEKIVVPLDGSQRAEYALSPATTLTGFYHAELVTVHVVARPEMPRRAPPNQEDTELAERLIERNRQEMSRYLEQLQARVPVPFTSRLLVSDDVSTSLHSLVEAEQADLVVMSAHGYSGRTRQPYGSVTVDFIDYGATPLLIIQDLAPGEVQSTPAESAAREHKGH